MDALGILVAGAGAFLVYAAYKGEHPWAMFTSTVTSASGGSSVNPGNAASSGAANVAALQASGVPGTTILHAGTGGSL